MPGLKNPDLTTQIYERDAKQSGEKYGVPFWVMWGVLGMETDYGKNVSTSSAGAKGFYQFIESTAKSYGYPYTNDKSPTIFHQQSDIAARYLSQLHKEKGSWDAALKAYSGGGYGEKEVRAKGGAASFSQNALEKANPLPGAAEAAIEGVETVAAWGKDFAKLLEFITSSSGWLRIGKVTLGLALLIVAVDELTKMGPGPKTNVKSLALKAAVK